MANDISVYGLLYLASQNRNINLKTTRGAIDVYIKCAATCAASFQRLGYDFALITNEKEVVEARIRILGIENLRVVGYTFRLKVPEGVRFYSAHYKIEVIGAFAAGAFGEKAALVDLDTVLLKELPPSSDLTVYDISSQVFAAYGEGRVANDLAKIAGRSMRPARWFGGEFILGSREQYRDLCEEIEKCWPRYLQDLSELHHVGDEMVISAALNLYADKNRINDFGADGAVVRWWSVRTRHVQGSLASIRNAALVHLPADKQFFVDLFGRQLSAGAVLDEYARSIRFKLWIRRMFEHVSRIRGNAPQFVSGL